MWLAPGEVVWIDVIVPVGHAGWADDIHRPMVWLGHHLARAFDAVGVDGVDVHDGPMETTPQSRLVCFDGLGPGEVTRHGGKLVGMSQRRTRSAARLQCCWYTQHEHDSLAELLLPEVSVDDLRPVATVDSTSAAAVVPLLAASLG